MKTLIASAIIIFIMLINNTNSLAQDQSTKIKLIVEAAKEICTLTPLNSNSQHVELSAESKIKLNSVLKKLMDAGVDAAGKYSSSKSFGVLQKDLAGSIKNGNDCRSDFAKSLMDKIFSELDSAGKTRLAQAQSQCEQGNIATAKKTFQNLKVSYPNNSDVSNVERWCLHEISTSRQIIITIQNRPSIFFEGYEGDLFRGSMSIELDESYCGRISTLSSAVDSIECEITPGLHRFSMTGISIYNSHHQRIARGLECGGQTQIPINAENFGIILCFKRQNFACTIMESDEKYQNFKYSDCPGT